MKYTAYGLGSDKSWETLHQEASERGVVLVVKGLTGQNRMLIRRAGTLMLIGSNGLCCDTVVKSYNPSSRYEFVGEISFAGVLGG